MTMRTKKRKEASECRCLPILLLFFVSFFFVTEAYASSKWGEDLREKLSTDYLTLYAGKEEPPLTKIVFA